MSKVDVLAWLDAKVERELEIERATGLPNNARKPAIAVRAAVAEMIEAMWSAKALATCCMAVGCYSRKDLEQMGRAMDQVYHAALANIGRRP